MWGKHHTAESKQKNRESHLGENNYGYKKPRSKETKQKLKEANIGENNPMYGKTGEKHPTSKRVYQYDLDGTFIDSFGSSGEVGRYLEKPAGHIRSCACNKRKTAYKFKWSYTFPFM
jgi:hypothetical protein